MNRTKELPRQTESVQTRDDREICFLRAVDLAQKIRAKELSVREAMQAHLRQIARANPKVNAIVTLVPEDQLMQQAEAADDALAKRKAVGALHGVPVAVKDLTETRGIRTTYGSPIFTDFIPKEDAPVVKRMKKAGAIVLGKTNTSEFGMGSQTFNAVFGATLNPYDPTKTCGGSTGGGAVALACGMAPIANGSDMGGSLRNPANFCNVVGFRPSPGVVPDRTPMRAGIFPLSVPGPMARNVTDCAVLLGILAGSGPRSKGHAFLRPLGRTKFKGTRVAMVHGLGLPWESGVINAFRAQRKVLESLGCVVEQAEPDLSDADDIFMALRHAAIEFLLGPHVDAHPDKVNAFGHWHAEEGRKQTRAYLAQIEAKQRALQRRVRQFMKKYAFLLLPVNQVLPFDVNWAFPKEIAGVKMENYVSWMRSTYYISVLGNPAISVPCAFSKDGLPIGIQIVGRLGDDRAVLQLAYAFEQATHVGDRLPTIV
jgi:amidase